MPPDARILRFGVEPATAVGAVRTTRERRPGPGRAQTSPTPVSQSLATLPRTRTRRSVRAALRPNHRAQQSPGHPTPEPAARFLWAGPSPCPLRAAYRMTSVQAAGSLLSNNNRVARCPPPRWGSAACGRGIQGGRAGGFRRPCGGGGRAAGRQVLAARGALVPVPRATRSPRGSGAGRQRPLPGSAAAARGSLAGNGSFLLDRVTRAGRECARKRPASASSSRGGGSPGSASSSRRSSLLAPRRALRRWLEGDARGGGRAPLPLLKVPPEQRCSRAPAGLGPRDSARDRGGPHPAPGSSGSGRCVG